MPRPLFFFLNSFCMASSRVGGTKGLMSGSVGQQTYYIIKSDDGRYYQRVQAKKEYHTDNKTLRLATQRMCTAIIEAMMRDLKPIAKMAFQSAKNKTQSVNAFSSFNLRLLAQDCRQHWDNAGDFYYPAQGEKAAVAGPFYLSSGSLKYDAFEAVWHFPDWYNSFPVGHKPDCSPFMNGVCVSFTCSPLNLTVGDFLKENRLQFTTGIYLAAFWHHFDAETERESNGYKMACVNINPRVRDSEPITEEIIKSLFVVQSTDKVQVVYNPHTRGVAVGSLFEDTNLEYTIYSIGAFTRDYDYGRICVSSHKFVPAGTQSWPYIINAYPAMQLYGWMDMPQSWIAPYPW